MRDKAKHLAKVKEIYFRQSLEQLLLKSSKYNAKIRNLEHSITLEDIKIPERCPILDIPLFKQGGTRTLNSPTLDRVDNSLGYVPGNVRVISHKANTHKSNMSKQDIERLYKYVLGLDERST